MLQSIVQVLFSTGKVVFKQTESPCIVTIRHHFARSTLHVQLFRLHRFDEIVAQPQGVENKVQGKELVDDTQGPHFLGSIEFVRPSRHCRIFRTIIGCFAVTVLQERGGMLQFLRIAEGMRLGCNTVRRFTDTMQGGDEKIPLGGLESLIEFRMEFRLVHTTLRNLALQREIGKEGRVSVQVKDPLGFIRIESLLGSSYLRSSLTGI